MKDTMAQQGDQCDALSSSLDDAMSQKAAVYGKLIVAEKLNSTYQTRLKQQVCFVKRECNCVPVCRVQIQYTPDFEMKVVCWHWMLAA